MLPAAARCVQRLARQVVGPRGCAGLAGDSEERAACLALLGLAPGASAVEVRGRYLELAKARHPDAAAQGASGAGGKAGAGDAFRRLRRCYEVLGGSAAERGGGGRGASREVPAWLRELRE